MPKQSFSTSTITEDQRNELAVRLGLHAAEPPMSDDEVTRLLVLGEVIPSIPRLLTAYVEDTDTLLDVIIGLETTLGGTVWPVA